MKEHIDDLYSGTNEIAAKLKHFNHNYRQPVSLQSPEKESESASQKPVRATRLSDKESKSDPQKAAPTSCLFDNKSRSLSQEPTLYLY